MSKNREIPAVKNAGRVLQVVSEGKLRGTLQQMADIVAMPKTSFLRLLRSLESMHWIEKHEDGVYNLASGLIPLLSPLADLQRLFQSVRASMQILTEKTGHSAKLSIRRSARQVVIGGVSASAPRSMHINVGARSTILDGVTGAALLSSTPPQEREALYQNVGTNPYAEYLGPQSIEELIAQCQKDGFCTNADASDLPIVAMAAAIKRSDDSVLAALTIVSLPNKTSKSHIDECGKALCATALDCKKLTADFASL